MLEGFVEGGKYVIEEKLVGGRLLCHDLGIEGNKRIVPLGSRVMNKLYTENRNDVIMMYDGVRVQAYNNSILSCCRDSDGLYLKGIFYKYTDCSGFCEGGIYIFKGTDQKGNILVSDSQSGVNMKIPKGVILSPDEYNQWCYDGENTILPLEGSEIWCTSIRDEIIFVGDFNKQDGVFDTSVSMRCPNCGSKYDQISNSVRVRYSGNARSEKVDNEVCSKYTCPSCGSLILKSDERLGSICISNVVDE